MTNPRHYLLLMGIYLAVVIGVCLLLWRPLESAFMANWGFNLLIMGALAVGIVINFHQVLRLEPELNWISIFRTGDIGISVAESPRLMKPLAKHLEGLHRDRFRLSAYSLNTVLEGIRGRLDESREISRYMIGLLVFLGLLGTFWGLLQTIAAVGQVVSGLEVGGQEFTAMFQTFKAGLEKPLGGMGTAFSSSLFGLGGSLVLGFIDIQAGHAQNRFFNDLEEWLSGVTQLIDKPEPADLDTVLENGALGTDARLNLLIRELHENTRYLKALTRHDEPAGPEADSGE